MDMDSRWLYRAAGTVGLAGGFLLLGAGGAQADETENTDPELLPALPGVPQVPGGPQVPGLAGLPELPPLAVPGVDRLVGGQLGAVPLDGLGLPGGSVDLIPSLDPLARIDAQRPLGLPTRFAPGTAARTLPAAAATAPTGVPASERTEIIGPGLLSPTADALLGGQSLGNLVEVGDLTGQLPVAGPMINQTARSLPVGSDIVPATDGQVPAVIADELAADGGFSPEIFGGNAEASGQEEVVGGVPLLGPALAPLGQMVGVGNLAQQLPVAGPLTGSALGGLPVVGSPAPAVPVPAMPAPQDPAVSTEVRPIAGEDPLYAEYGEYGQNGGYGYYESPDAGTAAAEAGAEALPISGLTQQLPLADQLPLGALPASASMLQSLPVVGSASAPAVLPI
jgi:hypothetical protein